jgi:WD40 repeat protein
MRTLATILFLTFALFVRPSIVAQPFVFRSTIGFSEPNERIIGYTFADGGRTAVIVGRYNIDRWDVASGKLLSTIRIELPNPNDLGIRIVFNPAATLAIVLDEFTWRIIRKEKKVTATAIDTRTGKTVALLERPTESIRKAAWSSNGDVLVTYSGFFNDKRTEVCFWNGDDLSLRACIMVKGNLGLQQLSDDGNAFFSSSEIGTEGLFNTRLVPQRLTAMWSTSDGRMIRKFTADGGSPFIWSMFEKSVSRNSRYLAANLSGGKVAVWEINKGDAPKYEISPRKKNGYASFQGFSESGERFLFSNGNDIEIYRTEDGKLVSLLIDAIRKGGSPQFINGDRLIGVDRCDRTDVYDIDLGRKLYELQTVCKTEFDPVSTSYRDFDVLRLDPSGLYLLTSSDKTHRLWDAQTGAILQTLVAPDRANLKRKDPNKDDGLDWSSEWSADGRFLYVIAANGKSILVWER